MSQVGEGSTFVVRIPMERTKLASEPEPFEALGARTERPGLRVLAAEDHETNRTVLKVLLGQVVMEPTFAVTDVSPLKPGEQHTWDVILMDI